MNIKQGTLVSVIVLLLGIISASAMAVEFTQVAEFEMIKMTTKTMMMLSTMINFFAITVLIQLITMFQ